LQKKLVLLDDASTELMMGGGDDTVLLELGEAWVETTEDEATESCETQVEDMQSRVDKLNQEEEDIAKEQATLKEILYGRFGKSINLEEK